MEADNSRRSKRTSEGQMMRTDTWYYKFYYNFFGRNVWALVHFATAILVTKLVFMFLPLTWSSFWLGVKLSVILAFTWEVLELIFEILLKKKTVDEVYGTPKHYIEDTVGDILCAIIGFGFGIPWILG